MIVDRSGEERLTALPRPYVDSAEGGLDPDIVAQMFGFSSGDQMLQTIAAAPSMRQAVEHRCRAAADRTPPPLRWVVKSEPFGMGRDGHRNGLPSTRISTAATSPELRAVREILR